MHMTFKTGTYARYTVTHRGNCILIEGEIPIDALKPLTGLAPKNAVIDPDVARMAGVNLAFGPAKDMKALREELAKQAENVEASKPANKDLSDAAVKWLGSGERGISSNTMFTVLTGVDALGSWGKSHPHDPADLRRCRLLLEACPELVPEMHRLVDVSPEWARLVWSWDELCSLMDSEAPNWRKPNRGGSAPKTYDAMKSILYPNGR